MKSIVSCKLQSSGYGRRNEDTSYHWWGFTSRKIGEAEGKQRGDREVPGPPASLLTALSGNLPHLSNLHGVCTIRHKRRLDIERTVLNRGTWTKNARCVKWRHMLGAFHLWCVPLCALSAITSNGNSSLCLSRGSKKRVSFKNIEEELSGQFLKGFWLDFLYPPVNLRGSRPEKDLQADKHIRIKVSDSSSGPWTCASRSLLK